MKIITVNLSEPAVRALQILQDLGLYPSRSEAIRVAIRDYLKDNLGLVLTNKETPVTQTQQSSNKKEIARLLRKLRDEQSIFPGGNKHANSNG